VSDLGRVALDDPVTQRALREYRSQTTRTALQGVAGLVAGIVLLTAPLGDPGEGFVAGAAFTFGSLALVLGGLVLMFGGGGLVRAVHAGRVLRSLPWTHRRASYRIEAVGRGQPAMLIKPDDQHEEAVCSVFGGTRELPQGPDVPVLLAGDPRKWSVVTSPDRSILVVAKRPLLPLWGKLLRRYATTWPEPS
jgi:hypothetical protein